MRDKQDSSGRPSWKAGVARARITPTHPIWMSGYNTRSRATGEVLADLWCKALAIEDPAGVRGVILSAELCGVPADLSEKVAGELSVRFELPREAVMITVTHTHSGPMIEGYLEALSCTMRMSAEERADVARYTRWIEEELVRVASSALEDLEPVALSHGIGRADIAVNRRNNPVSEVAGMRARGEPLAGPVDHDLPVLAAARPDGRLKALLAAYACHATVLAGDRFSGDWPGFAQAELEERYPGATVLFVAGCAGDADPIPRKSVELAREYGRRFADAVTQAVNRQMQAIAGRLDLEHAVVELPFHELPDKETLRELASLPNQLEAAGKEGMSLSRQRIAEVLRARVLLRKFGQSPLPRTYSYPMQCWRLGDGLTWLSLAGEVTSGYALRIRRELGAEAAVWVTAFAHDVMGYIPTRTVWEEGGYEGDTSAIYYALPARWTGEIEEIIVRQALQLARPKLHG